MSRAPLWRARETGRRRKVVEAEIIQDDVREAMREIATLLETDWQPNRASQTNLYVNAARRVLPVNGQHDLMVRTAETASIVVGNKAWATAIWSRSELLEVARQVADFVYWLVPCRGCRGTPRFARRVGLDGGADELKLHCACAKGGSGAVGSVLLGVVQSWNLNNTPAR